jgi:PAS domain S-box-containing protein
MSRQKDSQKHVDGEHAAATRSHDVEISNIMLQREINECHKAELSTIRFAQILDASSNEIYMFDADSLKFIDTNRGARENLGYSMEELSEMTPADLKPEITDAEFRRLLEPLRSGVEREVIFETSHQRKDGSVYPVEVRIQFDIVVNRPTYTALILDITHRRVAESELAIRDRAISEASSGVIITDFRRQDNPIVYVNPAFLEITGYALNEIIGRNCRFLSADDTDQEGLKEVRAAISSGRSCKVVVRNYRKDRSMFWNELTISPVHDREGKISHYVGIQNDITEHKRREEENEKLALLAEHTNNLVVITDKNGHVEWVNQGFTRITGFQQNEALDKNISVVLESSDAFVHNIDKICKCITDETALNLEHRIYTKSGKEVWIELNIQPVYSENGVRQYVATGSDISRRKITENALRESQERLSLVMQGANDGIWDWNILTGEVYYSSRFLELLKYKKRKVQRNINLFSERLHPSDRKKTWFLINNHLNKRDIFDCEFRMRTDDRGYRWFRARGQASWLADNTPSRMAGSIMDVTSRKKAETEANNLRDKLEKHVIERTNELVKARDAANASNRAKSAFLASMSHELRTPMNGVVGMVEVLQKSFLSQDQAKMVHTIRESAIGLLNILDDILDFSKIEAGKLNIEYIPVSLMELIESVSMNLVPNAAMKNLQFELYIDPGLPGKVVGDPVRLRQILFNLLGNAIKFTKKKESEKQGKVWIRIERNGKMRGEMVPLCFRIIDNGIGMSEAVQSQLFQPFTQADSSTTRRFGGSGLGLSITHRLVEMLGGEIEVKSKEAEGSEFIVSLDMPIAHGADEDCQLFAIKALIVTDNPVLSEAMHAYLLRAGATIQQMNDLETAHQWIEQEKPDLVVLEGSWCQEDKQAFIQSVHQSSELSSVRFVAICSRPRLCAIANYPGVSWVESNPLLPSEFLQAVKAVLGRTSEVVFNQEKPRLAIGNKPPSREAAEADGTLILVAEDNLINQEVIRRQLNLLGYAVDIADNGSDALEKYKLYRYGLLLTDCHMPEMDGFDLTQSIRMIEANNEIRLPIVALTANVMQSEASCCLEAGMDGYLFKPVELEELKQTVNKWLPLSSSQNTLHVTPTGVSESDSDSDSDSDSEKPPADINVLTKLVGNDPLVHIKLLEGFLLSTRQMLDEINTAWGEHSASVVSGLMHKLKSSVRSVGAKALGNLCEEMEMAGKAGNWQQLSQLEPRFMEQCNDVLDYLESYLKMKKVS